MFKKLGNLTSSLKFKITFALLGAACLVLSMTSYQVYYNGSEIIENCERLVGWLTECMRKILVNQADKLNIQLFIASLPEYAESDNKNDSDFNNIHQLWSFQENNSNLMLNLEIKSLIESNKT